MADKKIWELPFNGNLSNSTVLPIGNGLVTQHTSLSAVTEYLKTYTVQSVTGYNVDNTDPKNPIILSVQVDGTTISGTGEDGDPLVANSPSPVNYYKFSKLPTETNYVRYYPDEDLLGQAYDLGIMPDFYPYVKLNNGNLAELQYCQSILSDGTFIFEAYEVQSENEIYGYWVAMRKSSTDPQKLIKVSELIMTQQFWDYWYDYTVEMDNTLGVKLVSYSNPLNDSPLNSWITELTLVNDELVVNEISYDFSGKTASDLWFDKVGSLAGSLTYRTPIYSSNNDWTGMLNGEHMGWIYLYDYTSDDGYQYVVGYNILTGESNLIEPQNGLENVTNFSGNPSRSIIDFVSHPMGVMFLICEIDVLNTNGTDLQGVSAVWSPIWVNNTKCVRLNSRIPNNSGVYDNIGGRINALSYQVEPLMPNINLMYSPKHLFVVYSQPSSLFLIGAINVIDYVYRFSLDSDEPANFKQIPRVIDYTDSNYFNGFYNVDWYPTDNGLYFYTNDNGSYVRSFSSTYGIFWNDNEINPVRLQTNESYISKFIGDKTFGAVNTFGYVSSSMVTINKYNNINF